MKFHLALNTQSFQDSVDFYRAFLGAEPVKHKPGYAKFDVDSPPLNLTLNDSAGEPPQGESIRQRSDINHLGFQVDSEQAVKAARDRLSSSGLVTWSEDNVDCCYALQDKVWVRDPNGVAWEVFYVKVADTAPELKINEGRCCDPATITGDSIAEA